MKHLDLFSGIGGFALAARNVWGGEYENVGFVDFEPYCQQVLKKNFPQSTIHGDIKQFNGKGISADIITGGFPCQPYSQAGKRKGKEDTRHLWPEMLRVIREVSPRWIVGENVRGLVSWNGGLVFDEVQSNLEDSGYEVIPFLLPACAVNAPHRRERIWFIAYRDGGRLQKPRAGKQAIGFGQSNEIDTNAGSIERSGVSSGERQKISPFGGSDKDDPNATRTGLQCAGEAGTKIVEGSACGRGLADDCFHATDTTGRRSERGDRESDRRFGSAQERSAPRAEDKGYSWDTPWTTVATELCGMGNGLPAELDGFKLTAAQHRKQRLKGLGNAIVPQVAEQIFRAIKAFEEMV